MAGHQHLISENGIVMDNYRLSREKGQKNMTHFFWTVGHLCSFLNRSRSWISLASAVAMGSRDADYEEFLALRKHVRKLQQGTPLLLNSLGGEDNPQIYQICHLVEL